MSKMPMQILQNMSIRRKQVLIIMLTTTVALLLACAAFTAYEVITFRATTVKNLSKLAKIISSNTSAALDSGNPQSAEEALAALRFQPNIIGACVFSGNGNIFARYDRTNDKMTFPPPKFQKEGHSFGKNDLVLSQPIVSKGDTIGVIYLVSDMQALHSRLAQDAVIFAVVMMLTLFVTFRLSNRLQRLTSDPVLELLQTARAVAKDKNYSLRVSKNNPIEMGTLIDGFNEMLAQIQERDANLERRVQERTAELAQSVSMFNATLESTADGILAMDLSGQVVTFNHRFAKMWGFPAEMLERRDAKEMIAFVVNQLKDSDKEKIIRRIKESQTHPEGGGFDAIELKDGRRFERYVLPQQVADKCVGMVVNWRDITQRKLAEEALWELQEVHRSLVEQLPVNVYRKDAEGRFTFVNSSFCRTKGKTADQILGQTAFAVNSKEEAEKVIQQHEFIMRTGKSIEIEESCAQPDGTMQYFQVVKLPVLSADGRIIGTQGIHFDITQRKQAEAKLAHERNLLRTVIDNSPDAIYVKDTSARKTLANRAELKNMGCKTEAEGVGKSDFDVFPQKLAAGYFADDQAVMQTGQPLINREEKVITPAGKTLWILSSKIPLRDDAGNIIGLVGMGRDITTIKEAELKLEQVHKQLLDASRQAGMAEVATSVLHNIGNVLNSVNVSSSLITQKIRNSKVSNITKAVEFVHAHKNDLADFFTNDPKGKQLPDYLSNLAVHLGREQEEMLHEVGSLEHNISHIKEIVAMQQNYAKPSGVVESALAVDLMEDAVRMNTGAMERHRVKVVREYADVPPILVEKHKVLQILVNLIRNAKYACDDSGREDKQITLRVANGGNRVKISVADNGVGIPAENLTRIFNHGFTTKKDGHGFGLHSGALAARELGGALTVFSEGQGRGAAFTLELPIQKQKTNI